MPPGKGGLEDVIAANSAISEIIGGEGKLTYRGIDIHELAEHSSFEETTYLLWYGRLPSAAELQRFTDELASQRPLPAPLHALMAGLPVEASPMTVLRTALSAMPLYRPPSAEIDRDASLKAGLRVLAQAATIVGAWQQIRQGRRATAPLTGGSHAENFLYLVLGVEPDALVTRAMDLVLVLHADHELNASTFAARVTAATLADVEAAVVSAVSALSGPLHGAASQQVMAMLQEVRRPEHVAAYVDRRLQAGRRVPGFGHRVYRTEDPRVRHLREMSRRLGEQTNNVRWYELSRELERAVLERCQLYANVDLYAASCYAGMGIPVDLFPTVFAVSRVAGWTAHVLEQYADNRLIRPRAEYVGERDVPYVPLDRRAS